MNTSCRGRSHGAAKPERMITSRASAARCRITRSYSATPVTPARPAGMGAALVDGWRRGVEYRLGAESGRVEVSVRSGTTDVMPVPCAAAPRTGSARDRFRTCASHRPLSFDPVSPHTGDT
ncbi:hypothetical protein GCM10022236_02130 [Microlunatus ginsengisoli]|uniref:Uncharacterized protein n=1 Tax=Microlunatus ginsengisoli TaxID=363863 RepID=A0ABP6ZB67_9ACTN